MPLQSDQELRDLLTSVKTIALVGASAKPERASNSVMAILLAHGYRVIPVNPGLGGQRILDQAVVERLSDIFRNSDAAGDSVDEAVAIGAKAVWMQLGVIRPLD
jgi:uncharacterized protein